MAKSKEAGGQTGEAVFSQAEVDALNLRIKDLEQQLKDRIAAHEEDNKNSADMVEELTGKLNEATDKLGEATKEIENLNVVGEKLEKIIKKNGDEIEELKEALGKKAGGKFKEIEVPALANKARVVQACLDVEKKPACRHVKKFIAGLRLYIDPESGK